MYDACTTLSSAAAAEAAESGEVQGEDEAEVDGNNAEEDADDDKEGKEDDRWMELDECQGPWKSHWSTLLNVPSIIPECNITSPKTPLQIAIMGGSRSAVSMLLRSNCNCNVQDADGVTPLMSALSAGEDKIVADLIYEGKANVNAVDNKGRTALQYSFAAAPRRRAGSIIAKTALALVFCLLSRAIIASASAYVDIFSLFYLLSLSLGRPRLRAPTSRANRR